MSSGALPGPGILRAIPVDGFEMELATAQAKGGKSKASRKRSDAQVFKLSSSVREAIVRALPEPWTEESL